MRKLLCQMLPRIPIPGNWISDFSSPHALFTQGFIFHNEVFSWVNLHYQAPWIMLIINANNQLSTDSLSIASNLTRLIYWLTLSKVQHPTNARPYHRYSTDIPDWYFPSIWSLVIRYWTTQLDHTTPFQTIYFMTNISSPCHRPTYHQ